ncbi:MAG: STM3941 family protein [Bacteroidia bacterium]
MTTEIKGSRYMPIFTIGLSVFYLWGVVPKIWENIQNGQFFSLKTLVFLAFGSFLVWQAVRFIKYLIEKKPVIIIDERGFTDNVSPIKAGLIPWEEISGVELKKGLLSSSLIIKLHDPEKVMIPLSGMKENMARSLLKSKGSPVIVQDNLIDYKLKNLAQLIEGKIA